MLLEGVVLVIDDTHMIAVLQSAVVVEGRKARKVQPDGCLPDPPVEINKVRVVLLDEFGRSREPVVCPSGRDVSEIIIEWAIRRSLQPSMSRAIKRCIFGIVHIGTNRASRAQEEVVLYAMR